MLEPKKIDEIIAEIMGETFAKIKFPNADSFCTSVERKITVSPVGTLEPVLYVTTKVYKKCEIIKVEIKIIPTNQ